MAAQAPRPEALLDLIYDAVLDDRLWPGVVQGVASWVGAGGGVLIGFVASTDQFLDSFNIYSSNMDEAVLRDQVVRRHLNNPWAHFKLRRPDLEITTSDDVMPLSAFRYTDFYNDCVRPQRFDHTALINLLRQQDIFQAFSICHNKPFTTEQLHALEGLLPDLRRGFLLSLRYQGYKALLDANQQALDLLPEGIVLMDRGARVLFANRAALAYQGLLLARVHGDLRLLAPGRQNPLNQAVQSVLDGAASAALALCAPGRPRPLSVLVVRARESALDRLSGQGLGNVAVMMFIRDPQRPASVPQERLAVVWRLTPAECGIALKVAEGLNIPRMAEALELSANTVKTHLNHIYSKMGISGQAQLARMLQNLDLG